jgi:hypothetical protein
MNSILEFLPEASAEADCITGDYEARTPGLGVRFREEVESVCAAIVQHPLLWRERPGGYRRVNLPGFPYRVCTPRGAHLRHGGCPCKPPPRLLEEPDAVKELSFIFLRR